MGFRIKIAPGVRVSVGHRGVRTHVGPRIARVHVGSGRTGVSTGIGPLTLYGAVGSSTRRRSSSSGGGKTTSRSSSSGSAGYRGPGTDRYSAPQADKSHRDWELDQARATTQVFQHIDDLLQQPFEDAERPIVPLSKIEGSQPGEPQRTEADEEWDFVNQADGKQASGQPGLHADNTVTPGPSEAELARIHRQWVSDAEWNRLLENDPDVVLAGVNRAFEDNKARASAISVEK